MREFSSNPVATVLADRGAYIAACLTICRAYIVAGRPSPARKLASFEGWSDTVRSALIWLGKADCIDSMETSREEDPERSELRGHADGVVRGDRHRFRTSLDAGRCDRDRDQDGGLGTAKDCETSGLARRHPGRCHARPGSATDIKTLGRWMQRRKGRVIDGLCFAAVSNPKGGSKWWVEDPHRHDHHRPDDLFPDHEEGGSKGD